MTGDDQEAEDPDDASGRVIDVDTSPGQVYVNGEPIDVIGGTVTLSNELTTDSTTGGEGDTIDPPPIETGPIQNREFSGEMEISIDVDQYVTVVCPHCGEANLVPDTLFWRLFGASCRVCGGPLPEA